MVHAWAREFLREEHRTEYSASLRTLVKFGHDLEASLRLIPGIKVHPSSANFVLLELTDPAFDADRIYVGLGCRGILVRVCDSFYGMPKGRFLRVAVRTAEENRRLVDTLSTVCCTRTGQSDYHSPITNHQSLFTPVASHQTGRIP